MTCIHIQKVKDLVGERLVSVNMMGVNNTISLNMCCECSNVEITSPVGRGTKCREIGCQLKKEILNILNECNCVETKEWEIKELKRKAGDLESNQLVLARDKSGAESSLIIIQSERDSLKSNNWYSQEQIREKNELIRSGERVLQTTQSQLTTTQNQLTRKNNEYNDLNQWFNNLQITLNNKDNEINELRQDLGNSQNIELRYKERKLDELIHNSGLNQIRVINLRNAYEKLRVRENYNRNDIVNANTEIETIKAEFFQINIDIDDLHKIYKTCEKVADLRVKLENQYEARQEVPPRH